GVEFLPELEAVKWMGRNVYICFDSDYKTNPMVCSALMELAEELLRRGAFPHVVSIPEVPGLDKTGLDDYIMSEGARMFRIALSSALPLGDARALHNFNKRFAFVMDPGLVVSQETLAK